MYMSHNYYIEYLPCARNYLKHFAYITKFNPSLSYEVCAIIILIICIHYHNHHFAVEKANVQSGLSNLSKEIINYSC